MRGFLRAGVTVAAVVLVLTMLGAWVIGEAVTAAGTSSQHSRAVWLAEVRHGRAVWLAEVHHAGALERTRDTLERRAWLVQLTTPIAVCEEGGWVGRASDTFPDSLGLTAANWQANGGGVDVRPFVQALVELRFTARWGIGLPDRAGCAAY